MPQSNELRLFISSTFRDLQEEREHLVKKIFPEIRALCRERGVTFTEVDLRWGLTEENALLGQVIRTCLEEVDKCRPYFIGMIGNRYGWVPEFHEILMDPDLLAKYPWIEEVALEGASVTEMEFTHGVFDALPTERAHAFFYHREENRTEADDPGRLAALIERARATGHPFKDFTSAEELGQIIHEDLIALINEQWPLDETPSPVDLERRAHSAFSASRTRAYIPNPVYLKEFVQWSSDGETPLIVHGESGLGKSSLVAWLTDYYRKKNPNAFVIEHYVGASDRSGSAAAIMRHIIEDVCQRFSIDEQLPETEAELEKSFAGWLFRAEHLAGETETPVLLVLDALNQLGDYGRRLAWLPKTIPAGIKLLISTTPGETEERLIEREWNQMKVVPLEDERVRQSIVVRYLGEFKKGITPEQLRRITGDPKGSSPLYLRVVAEELRLHGEHETIDQQIDLYTAADDLLGVFDQVLRRIERDYGEGNVRSLLSLIALSRSGLNEIELLELTGITRLELSRLLFAFDYHLIHRNGLLSFFHDYLRRAVEKRYLMDPRIAEEQRELMVRFFRGEALTLRSAQEVMWQLKQGENPEAVAEYLGSIAVLRILYSGERIYEIQSTWRELVEKGVDIEMIYQRSVEEYRQSEISNEEKYEGLGSVCKLLKNMSYWARVVTVVGEMRQIAEEMGDKPRVCEADHVQAEVDAKRGSYDAAMVVYQRLLGEYAETGNQTGMASTHNGMGLVYSNQSEYDRALESYQQALTLREQLGEKSGVATVIINIGSVYLGRGEYDRALDSYQQALAIHQELGERSRVAIVNGHIGLVYSHRGEYDRALEYSQESLAIHQDLGDKSAVAKVILNIGIVYYERHEYNRALEYYQKALTIHRELGEELAIAVIVGNIGCLYLDVGNYHQALEHLTRAISIHREMKFRVGIMYWANPISQALIQICRTEEGQPDYMAEYIPELKLDSTQGTQVVDDWKESVGKMARSFADECFQIAKELGDEAFLCKAKLTFARVDELSGESQSVQEQLLMLIEESDDQEFQAECCYWLSTFYPSSEEHRTEALRRYTALLEKGPKQGYRDVIDELKRTAGIR